MDVFCTVYFMILKDKAKIDMLTTIVGELEREVTSL